MRRTKFFIVLLVCSALPVAAQELTAVSPSTVSPGTRVTLSGGPFAHDTVVVLGDQRINAEQLENGRLMFTVPILPSGEYVLAVEHGGVCSVRPFVLRVIQAPPRIRDLDPSSVDSCGGDDNRQVTVSGSNFQPSAELLLDNAALAIDKRSANELVFTVPPIKSGLHQVQVVNPDSQSSLPRGLVVNNTPEIGDVQLGDDRTIEYELVLRGKNFTYNSQVILNGAATSPDLAGAYSGMNRDRVRFVDCTTLIYIRQPMVREAHELSLQIVNAGGEQSNVYRITAP